MDLTTRDLERSMLARPGDTGVLVRWAVVMGRAGRVRERSIQETIAQKLGGLDAAARVQAALDCFGVKHGRRKLALGKYEIEEFDFALGGYDWTIQCEQARFEHGSGWRVPLGRKITVDIFDNIDVFDRGEGSDTRHYEYVTDRTLVRFLAEPPARLAVYGAIKDAAVLGEDPEFRAFAAELRDHGAIVSAIHGVGGCFDIELAGVTFPAAWNQRDVDEWGPNADIFTRAGEDDEPLDSLVILGTDVMAFNHPLDALDAMRAFKSS